MTEYELENLVRDAEFELQQMQRQLDSLEAERAGQQAGMEMHRINQRLHSRQEAAMREYANVVNRVRKGQASERELERAKKACIKKREDALEQWRNEINAMHGGKLHLKSTKKKKYWLIIVCGIVGFLVAQEAGLVVGLIIGWCIA